MAVLTSSGKPYGYDFLQQMETDLLNLAHDASFLRELRHQSKLLRDAAKAVADICNLNGEDDV